MTGKGLCMIRTTNMLRYTVLVFSMLFLLFACATTQGVNSKEYGCTELRQLVQSEGSLDIKGLFGDTTAYASPRACNGFFQRPQRSTWRTSDKVFCEVGFVCQFFDPDDDD